MNLQDFLIKRKSLLLQAPQYRVLCANCSQPTFSCFCAQIQSFDPEISFVILIHPIEVKRRIATGRMSHLCLKGSYLIKGQDYTENCTVNELIADSNYHSVILYPGINSKNISPLTVQERAGLFPKTKKLRLFIIDGTWATARKMIRQSQNLKNLPRICFSPTTPSNFRVRKQPHSACYSTIEAIHHTIELIGETQDFNTAQRQHDNLLHVFNYMVENQLEFVRQANLNLREASYRREGQIKSA